VAGNLGQGKAPDGGFKTVFFMKIIFIDGQYLKVNARIIEAFTPGILKAKGAFETILGVDGVVMDAALHLKRLRSGLKILGVKSPVINPSVLQEVLRRNHLSCGRLRLMVWQEDQQVHVMAAALPYKFSNKKAYRVCLIKTNRAASDRWAGVKSLDYEVFARSYLQAKTKGFDEALLLNRRGHIFEASRANIFWVKDHVLYTPPLSSGCLNGITRQQVLKQAANLKIPVKEKNLTPEILKKAGTAFLTNSLIGIKPIEVTMKIDILRL
jgi:branched-subunit amino acid aminotransferase/4-amino-4-deoxychorismate lyase